MTSQGRLPPRLPPRRSGLEMLRYMNVTRNWRGWRHTCPIRNRSARNAEVEAPQTKQFWSKTKMKLFNAATTVFCVALLGGAVATSAKADEWNRKTTIKFSAPVEIPGVHLKGWGVLPAGTYVFKVMDSLSDRHIVQIFSADETTLYATILAIPN